MKYIYRDQESPSKRKENISWKIKSTTFTCVPILVIFICFPNGEKNGIDTPGSIFSCFVTSKADSYFSVIFFMVVFWQFLFPLFEKKSKSTIFYVEYKFLSLSILLKRHLFIRFFFCFLTPYYEVSYSVFNFEKELTINKINK